MEKKEDMGQEGRKNFSFFRRLQNVLKGPKWREGGEQGAKAKEKPAQIRNGGLARFPEGAKIEGEKNDFRALTPRTRSNDALL